ncbi:MAG: cell division protein FtsI [Lachnospiraceae bacterium]|nr:cell division protein FtsI [Lachnospiraceae bacterium]
MGKIKKFTFRMRKKLMVLFAFVLAAFVLLFYRLYKINEQNGDAYKRQVLSQQQATSKTLPYRRGDIVDRKGSRLAYSEKVYNLVIDSKQMHEDDDEHYELTLKALEDYFPELDIDSVREYSTKHPSSRYRVVLKKLDYNKKDEFEKIMDTSVSMNNADGETVSVKPSGVWFEEDYKRKYPYNSLGCDVVGFVLGNNTGFYGLEQYYNDTLNGINGREYGYMNDDAVMEDAIQEAQDGNTIVTTLDTNIQSIAEKHIKLFYEKYNNAYREGLAAKNVGVIIMNPNNGEIYAMAGYPVFDLNDPEKFDPLELAEYVGSSTSENSISANALMIEKAENGEEQPNPEANTDSGTVSGDTVSGNAENKMDPITKAKNQIWRNFCISDAFEPGSVMKPFTVAGAIDAGKITGEETYDCPGYLTVGGHAIHCHNRLGDGMLTVQQGLAKSCNVVLMNIAFAMGKEDWLRYNRTFNFGLKTNIDLYGEANAAELTFDESMGQTDLAVASFGQGFNVTMIQMAAGFSALINGGYYYRPHVVSRIENSKGAVVQEVESKPVKQVISESTSQKMRDMLRTVVMSDPSECTGWSARPAGYTEGGKTGTAETYPRGNGNYIVSFMGYIPADNPQVVCYVVIDRPNAQYQSESTRMATVLNKDIMTEVLPYLNIFPTEELTEDEAAELQEKQGEFFIGSDGVSTNSVSEDVADGTSASEDAIVINPTESTVSYDSAGNVVSENKISYDPETGYPLDPATGEVLDPNTLQPINGNSSFMSDVN